MLKIGVAGAGHLGKVHIKILKELSALYNLVGFYDSDPNSAKEVESIEQKTQLKNQRIPTYVKKPRINIRPAT
jgi:predicted dinucleotide-utilizing enzyme